MADVTFTVHGKTLARPARTLLIEACKDSGIEMPVFYHSPGLFIRAAVRQR